jgi:primosomal protein N' (replication factor Y)
MCHQCGDVVKCHACDARMVLHQSPRKLICHHCGSAKTPPRICENCRRADLFPMGLGTERLEEILQARFPDNPILRIDRDTIKNKNQLDEALAKIHDRKVDILIGTQMLAKGHHFPALSLVAIVDSDNGFFSADFRGLEKMAQAIVQVAGRAGREEQIGEVVIQTHHPENPLLNILLKEGYSAFAQHVLKDRQAAKLPPFSHLALLRAEGTERELPIKYLSQLKNELQKNKLPHVDLWGPIPATMEKKAGRYRYHLMLQSEHRGNLQKMLQRLRASIKNLKSTGVRWILDVDPQEVI